MRLVFEQIRTGGDRNFGYLLGDRDAKQAVLIDPSYSPDVLTARAQEQGLRVTHVINTHGHPDHVNGNARAVEQTAAPVAAHGLLSAPFDIALADGQELLVGALRMRFLHTPGHCADHIVIHERSYGLAITGDLLFVGKVGGTESDRDARVEWESLQRVLATMPDETTVWPGHDYGVRPSSTIGLERQTNPFLLCSDVEAFLAMKQDWAAFKAKNGLK